MSRAGPTSPYTPLLAILAGSSALFLGTANPLRHLPLIVLLYPASLYVLGLTSPNPFRHGWLTGLLGASGALYWISVAVHDYGGFPWPPAIACALLLGAYVGLWGGLFAWLMALTRPLPPWRRCLAAFLLWHMLEWTRGWFLTGFPWLTLASAQAAWPALIQGASLGGDYMLSALYAGMGALLAQAWLMRQNAWAEGTKPGQAWPYALTACLTLALLIGFGLWRVQCWRPQGTPLRVSLVQGNLPQDVKWDTALRSATVDKYLSLSRQALAEARNGRPHIIVWPETAMPFYFQADTEWRPLLEAFARDNEVALLFGAPGYFRPAPGAGEPGQPLIHNRAFLLDARGSLAANYDKQHLVPFGEYIPPGFGLKALAALTQNVGGFTPGRETPPFRLDLRDPQQDAVGGEAVLGMLICYEAIFPEIARQRAAQGAEALINISNDAWYNKSSAPLQHLHLAAMRAVEQGRWLARGTNTGVTAFVDPLGRIDPLGGSDIRGGLFVDGILTRDMEALSGHTVFFHVQPWLPALAFTLVLIIVWPLVRSGMRRDRIGGAGSEPRTKKHAS